MKPDDTLQDIQYVSLLKENALRIRNLLILTIACDSGDSHALFRSSNWLMICRTCLRVSFVSPFSKASRVASARTRGISNKYTKASCGMNFTFSLARFKLLCV